MKFIKPTKNRLVRGYSTGHKGYDFAGLNLPDEVYAGADGTIIERVDLYVNNWTNTGHLTTRDYGNYIKIKHLDGTYELHAHLAKGSSLLKGTKVNAGQIVARIGNTGNSSGPHSHSEYRNAGNVNISAEFIDAPVVENPISLDDWKKSAYDRALILLKQLKLLDDDNSNLYKDNEGAVFVGVQKLIKDNEAHHRGYEEFKEKYYDLKEEVVQFKRKIDELNGIIKDIEKDLSESQKKNTLLQTEMDTALAKAKLDCEGEVKALRQSLQHDHISEVDEMKKQIEELKKSGVEVPVEMSLSETFKGKTFKDRFLAVLEVLFTK